MFIQGVNFTMGRILPPLEVYCKRVGDEFCIRTKVGEQIPIPSRYENTTIIWKRIFFSTLEYQLETREQQFEREKAIQRLL